MYANLLIAITAAYLIGCFSTGYYLVFVVKKIDVRTKGSGAVGARNTGRVLGAPGFIVTLLGDFAKGALAVWLAFYLGLNQQTAILAMLAVICGHIWPVQLNFRGGKGIATAVGALAVLDYRLLLVLLVLFAVIFTFLRKTTFCGLIVVSLCPVVSIFMGYQQAAIVGLAAMSVIILIASIANIYQIISKLGN